MESIVARLARALDGDDLPAAAECLAPDCVYETGRESLRGPAAIVASYAAASAWARRALDDVRCESAVEPPRDGVIPVLFTDYLMKAGGKWHRYRCRQEFAVGATGLVTRIVHRELPGERESLEAYFREQGIER